MQKFDDVSLIVNGKVLSGWMEVRVTRSIERFPSDFEIDMTEMYPGEANAFQVVPGDSCQVALGDDIVLTGYVDGYRPSLSPGNHSIRIYGRSKCSDLVDCAAEWPGSQIVGVSALQIAQTLAFAFGIAVEGIPEDQTPIPIMNLNLGEDSYSVIERVCRYRGLLAYDLPDGSLRLARAATIRSSSGIQEGKNVQACSVDWRIDGRFSEYVVMSPSMVLLQDIGDLGFLSVTVKDPGVRRHRRHYITAESATISYEIALRRADWEYRRRAGRSAVLHVTVDSWRDVNGMLWEPNTLVALSLPSMKVVDKHWLIVDVTYKRDGSTGTTCELRIMPPEAFEVQPPDLPSFLDIRKALAGTPVAENAASTVLPLTK
jgi:prophage tail gpP-like protein